MAWTNQDAALESGDGVPALTVTQVKTPRDDVLPKTPIEAAALTPGATPPCPAEVDPASTPALPQDVSPILGKDADMSCSDVLSLRSDTVSITGSRRSEESQEDDARSVTASSILSLFQRHQLDPLEKDWIKSCASGNTSLQRLLLHQEPGLVHKKDFITGFTALHWASKHGLQETLDLMIRSGADVNARSHGGYTALHLASIHGHQLIVTALVNIYNAKTNIRDYHGKMAAHYWSGGADIFTKSDSTTDGALAVRRRTQRHPLPSLLPSRPWSQGHLRLEFSLPHSASADLLEFHV